MTRLVGFQAADDFNIRLTRCQSVGRVRLEA